MQGSHCPGNQENQGKVREFEKNKEIGQGKSQGVQTQKGYLLLSGNQQNL